MAIPKIGSRKITVDGNVFIWKIKKHPNHNERHNVDYLIPVQHISNGQILRLSIGYNRSGYSFHEAILHPIITPSIISKCIKFAIAQGWKYTEKLPPLEMDCNSVMNEEAAFLTQRFIEHVNSSLYKDELCKKIAKDAFELCKVGEYRIALENIVSNILEHDIPLDRSIIYAAVQAFAIWQDKDYIRIVLSTRKK